MKIIFSIFLSVILLTSTTLPGVSLNFQNQNLLTNESMFNGMAAYADQGSDSFEDLIEEFTELFEELEDISRITDESIVTDYLTDKITSLRTDTENLVTDEKSEEQLTKFLDDALRSVTRVSEEVLELDEKHANNEIDQARKFIDKFIDEVNKFSKRGDVSTDTANILIDKATKILSDSQKRGVDATNLIEDVSLGVTEEIIDLSKSKVSEIREIANILESLGFNIEISSFRVSPTTSQITFSNPATQQVAQVFTSNGVIAVFATVGIVEESETLGKIFSSKEFAILLNNMSPIVLAIGSIVEAPSSFTFFDVAICEGLKKTLKVICVGVGIGGSIILDVINADEVIQREFEDTFASSPGELSQDILDFLIGRGAGLDIVVGGEDRVTIPSPPDLGILLNDGNGNFGTLSEISGLPVIRDIAIADFNSDGFDDIVTANNRFGIVTVLLGDGLGGFHPPRSFSVIESGLQPRPVAVTVSDFNNDGKVDIATSNSVSKSVSVLLNTTPNGAITPSFGSAKESQLVLSFFFATPTDLDDADFNNDGIRDLVSTEQRGTIIINIGRGDGRFLTGSSNIFSIATTPPNLSPQAVTAADFDGDGDTDVVAAEINLDKVFLMVNEGPRNPANNDILNFAKGGGTSVGGLNPVAIELLEDGAFVVTANIGSDNISVLRNTGSGFTLIGVFPVGADGPIDLAVGDLNGDGIQDVVTINRNSNNISVLFGTGGGGFGFPNVFGIGGITLPRAVAIGDFDAGS